MIAAIYSRKSKQSEKGESIENQIQMCQKYAQENLNINDFLIYEDEGFSGGNTNRPQFQKLLKDAKTKKFNVLICYRLDRISRNVADFSNTIEDLQKYNIDFVSIREQFDTSTPMGRAMMNIAAVFAQLERETIAERVKDNMIELSKTGRWLGGTAPLGYKSEAIEYENADSKSKRMFRLVEIPEEMDTVKLIYKLFLEKCGFNSTAGYLCNNNYKGKNGGEFSRGTVEQIIINPVYCISDNKIFDWFKNKGATVCGVPDGIHGLMVYNKREGGKKEKDISEWIIAVGKHKGTITSDTWLSCQKIIEDNKSKSSPRSGTGDKFLLSGLIVCGDCGSGMASWSHLNKKRNVMERYFRCNLKNRASTRCPSKMLNAYKAEEYVVENVKKIKIDEILKNNLEITNDIEEKNIVLNSISKLEKDKDMNNATIKGLIRKLALEDDDIDIIQMFKNEIKNLTLENEEIDKKIAELKTQIDSTSETQIQIKEIATRLETFKKFIDFVDDVNTKRQLIRSVVDSIIWHSDTETLEVNIVGSKKKLPNGKVKRRLCFGEGCGQNYAASSK